MKTSKTCEVACAVKLRKADQAAFIRAIDEEYRVHWIVDNLPVGMYATFENSHEVLLFISLSSQLLLLLLL